MKVNIPFMECAYYTVSNIEPGPFTCELPMDDHISNDANVIRYKDYDDYIYNESPEACMLANLINRTFKCGFRDVKDSNLRKCMYDTYFLQRYPYELHNHLMEFCERRYKYEYKEYIYERYVCNCLNQLHLNRQIDIFAIKANNYEDDYSDHEISCIQHYCNFIAKDKYTAYIMNH